MSKHPPAYRRVSPEICEGLAQLAIIALARTFASSSSDTDEPQALAEALQVLDPDGAKPRLIAGALHLARRNWPDAIDVLRSLSANAQCLPQSRAMLVYALQCSGDPEWRAEADALSDCADSNVSQLVQSVTVRAELIAALESGKRTGAFVVPESAKQAPAVGEQTKSDSAVSGTSMPGWWNHSLRA